MNSIHNRIGRATLAAALLLGFGATQAYAAGYTTIDEMLVTAPRVVEEQVLIAEHVQDSVARLAAEFGARPKAGTTLARKAPGEGYPLLLSGREHGPRG